MQQYCENIDGAIVEERSCAVVWNYQNTEEEHGSKFAIILAQHLQNLIGRNNAIEVRYGNGFIEVKPKQLSQEDMLKNLLENLQSYCKHQIESIMYIEANSIDTTTIPFLRERIDEDMHKQVGNLGIRTYDRPLFSTNCKSSFFVLGNRPSAANYFLE